MVAIEILDETDTIENEQQTIIQELLVAAAKSEGISDHVEVSLTFVDDETIQYLNHTYRNLNRPTDVLSFALQEGETDPVSVGNDEGMPSTLGELVISVTKAREQAATYNHSFLRELGFLAVHGFLHLCGYDHMTKEDEQEMFARQEDTLQSYGLKR